METNKKRYTYSNTYVYVGKGDKAVQFKKRKCLKCDKEKLIAESLRLCHSCTEENNRYGDVDYRVIL